MNCPYCNSGYHKVIDTREPDHRIRRRRECLKCGKRWTTYEITDPKSVGRKIGKVKVKVEEPVDKSLTREDVRAIFAECR